MVFKSRFSIISLWIVIVAACIAFSGCTSPNTQTPAQGTSHVAVTASQTTVVPQTTVPPASSATTSSVVPGTTVASAPASTLAMTTTQPASAVVITLNSAEKRSVLGTYTPKPGNIFLIMDITIKNTDKTEDFDYSPASFILYDKLNQKRYSPLTSVSGSLSNPLTTGKVPIKTEITGQIVFPVVNSGTNGYKFTVSDSSGKEIASFTNFAVS